MFNYLNFKNIQKSLTKFSIDIQNVWKNKNSEVEILYDKKDSNKMIPIFSINFYKNFVITDYEVKYK